MLNIPTNTATCGLARGRWTSQQQGAKFHKQELFLVLIYILPKLVVEMITYFIISQSTFVYYFHFLSDKKKEDINNIYSEKQNRGILNIKKIA